MSLIVGCHTSGAAGSISINGDSFLAVLPAQAGTNRVKVAICDKAGNMGYATKDYYVGTNEVTTAVSSYGYNTAGNLTNLNGIALDWDERYRLKSVTDSSNTVEYAYDTQDRRVSRIADGTTNYFMYNGNQVVADLDGSGNIMRSYVWGGGIDNLFSFTDHATSNTYYTIKDHQNSIIAFVDDSASIIESYTYDAWGKLKVYNSAGVELTESAIGNRYCFQGREIDWDTKLIYFRARWYNPVVGRWLSKDPIGLVGGLNLYEFCGNNPANYVDPNGCATVKVDGHVIRVHANDLDPFPTKPHGHILNSKQNQVIDSAGNIINKTTGKKVGKLSKGGLKRWTKFLGGMTFSIAMFALEPTATASDPAFFAGFYIDDEYYLYVTDNWLEVGRYMDRLRDRACQ